MDFIGVDPGITGAVAHIRVLSDGTRISCRLIDVLDIPTNTLKDTRNVEKQHIDADALAQAIKDMDPDKMIIENVGAAPGQGVVSMFRFGYAAALPAGIAAGLGVPVVKIFPKEWMRVVRLPSGDPNASRAKVAALFPAFAASVKRKKDHNRADAILLAYAGACQHFGMMLRTDL